VAFLKPSHIMDCGVRSRLNATVIAVDRFLPAKVCILEAGGFLLRNETLNILASRAAKAKTIWSGAFAPFF
jgi:hypothetical protein